MGYALAFVAGAGLTAAAFLLGARSAPPVESPRPVPLVELPPEQRSRIVVEANPFASTAVMLRLYNGSDFELRRVRIRVTARDQAGKERWSRLLVMDDVPVRSLHIHTASFDPPEFAGSAPVDGVLDNAWGVPDASR